jgi:DNA-binding response OmpR family regulator
MTDDAPSTILLVEDDAATRTFLADNLSADGYQVVVGGSVADGRRLVEAQFPDLVILDVGLPDGSGLDLVRSVRDADGIASRVDPRTPMLVLSGRGSELDRLRGFDRGCDDYLVKPFSYPELRARLGALLRRSQERPARGRLRVGDLELDPSSREASLAGQRLELSQKEFSLLRVLATEPARVYTKEELMRTVWGYRSMGTSRTLDSHACRLRAKLAIDGRRYIVNVWGVGYRLLDAPVAA